MIDEVVIRLAQQSAPYSQYQPVVPGSAHGSRNKTSNLQQMNTVGGVPQNNIMIQQDNPKPNIQQQINTLKQQANKSGIAYESSPFQDAMAKYQKNRIASTDQHAQPAPKMVQPHHYMGN